MSRSKNERWNSSSVTGVLVPASTKQSCSDVCNPTARLIVAKLSLAMPLRSAPLEMLPLPSAMLGR